MRWLLLTEDIHLDDDLLQHEQQFHDEVLDIYMAQMAAWPTTYAGLSAAAANRRSARIGQDTPCSCQWTLFQMGCKVRVRARAVHRRRAAHVHGAMGNQQIKALQVDDRVEVEAKE